MPDKSTRRCPAVISCASPCIRLAPDMLDGQSPDNVRPTGKSTSHRRRPSQKGPRLMRALLLACLSLPVAACGASDMIDDEGWLPEGKADEVAVPLKYKSYDVLFTNPLCAQYDYASPQE